VNPAAKLKVSPLPISLLSQIQPIPDFELDSQKQRESDIIIDNKVEVLTVEETKARKRQVLQAKLLKPTNTDSEWAQSERLIQFSGRAQDVSQGVSMDSFYRNEVD
jgi:hypothetical protein